MGTGTRTATSYPLQWPETWPRENGKEAGRFKSTLTSALNSLKVEVERLGAKNLVLSSNVTLGDHNPEDCGVVAYFQLRGQNITVPCDRWQKVEDNVKAIALTIEAMRGMERWGAKHMITAMFKGFKALPAKTGPSCWDVLGVKSTASEAEIMNAYRTKSKTAHPDAGGSSENFDELCRAKDIALSTQRSQA